MGQKFIDLTGQKFNRLIAMQSLYQDNSGRMIWLWKCDCGKECKIIGRNVRSGHTKSCGCLSKENRGRTATHGHSKNGKQSKIYMVWNGMIQRCNNPKHTGYKNYGGRIPPITVCDRWKNKKNGFQNFLNDVGEIPKGLTLDRINNNGNYEPNNCKLSSRKEQNRNTRTNRLIPFNNDIKCLTESAEKYNINSKTLTSRLKSRQSIKEVLMTPVRKHKKYKRRKR